MIKENLPEGWSNVSINSVLKKVRNPVEVDPEKTYREIGIRSHGKGIFHKDECLGESLGDKSVFWIEPDCFIVNIVFAWEQAVARTTTNESGMIASHRFPMYKPVPEKLDLDFILYFFKTPLGKSLLELASPGGAGRNKTLGQEGFHKLVIPLPPLAEQRKIAEILSTWDEAITKTERLIAALQARKKGLMQRLLTGQVRFPGFEGEWKIEKFSDILDIQIGRTPSRNEPLYWDSEKRTKNIWLSISDMQGKFIVDSKEYISDEGIRAAHATLVPKGTVLMSFKLTIGRVAIPVRDVFTNEAICAFFPKDKEKLLNRYLYHAISNVRFDKELDQAVKGQTLNMEKIRRLELSLPSYPEQLKIADLLDTYDELLTIHAKQQILLKLQKKGLMQRLLTGEIRVSG